MSRFKHSEIYEKIAKSARVIGTPEISRVESLQNSIKAQEQVFSRSGPEKNIHMYIGTTRRRK